MTRTYIQYAFPLFLLLLFIRCHNSNRGNGSSGAPNSSLENGVPPDHAKGVALIRQKCTVCHMLQLGQNQNMIAPPLVKVQEHYRPVYPKRADFVRAVIDYVNNPSKDKSRMPGAVKKFNLMPRLSYDQSELELIAGALYDMEFTQGDKGSFHRRTTSTMDLGNSKKEKLLPASIQRMKAALKNVNELESMRLEDYHQLGKSVFETAKSIMLDDAYTGNTFDQIHAYFNTLEPNMHGLIKATSLEEAKRERLELKEKLNRFFTYFE